MWFNVSHYGSVNISGHQIAQLFLAHVFPVFIFSEALQSFTLTLEIVSDEFEKRKKESLKVVCDFYIYI